MEDKIQIVLSAIHPAVVRKRFEDTLRSLPETRLDGLVERLQELNMRHQHQLWSLSYENGALKADFVHTYDSHD